jgi:hypothetical protein
MSQVTRILSQIDSGDRSAAEQLLPLVYDELRQLAAAKLAQEQPGQTLQATALVHEAYLRLVGPANLSQRQFCPVALISWLSRLLARSGLIRWCQQYRFEDLRKCRACVGV